MSNVNKLIYLPFITQICVILKQLFHIEIGTDMQDAIAVLISGAVTLYGIWMNRHKKEATYEYAPIEADRISAED